MFRIVFTLCIGKTITCDSGFWIPDFRVVPFFFLFSKNAVTVPFNQIVKFLLWCCPADAFPVSMLTAYTVDRFCLLILLFYSRFYDESMIPQLIIDNFDHC